MGDQSWEEMLLGMVTLSIDPQTDVTKIFEPKPRPPHRPRRIADAGTAAPDGGPG